MKKVYLKLVLVLFISLLEARTLIEQVDDTDLVHLLTGEDNVVVLFTKNNCPACDELETVLENVQKELKDVIGAVVVKAHNSHMVNLYDPSKEPALIYFRRGMPLLYYGEPNAEEIVQMFSENREPVVKELSDVNFEHLTQAATGATTGDWFVFFYSADCVFCLRLHATWEAVGARLKHRLNVARIDRLGAGIATAKRFGIVESPEFVFLRQGKVYRYKTKEYNANKLIEFVEKDYLKQTNPESVPPENNGLNSFLSDSIDSLMKSSQLVMLSMAVLLTIILGCIVKCLSSKRTTVENTSKAKKAK
ncbi:dnaJ homolog subfamily C member 10 [Lucilia cuprina]|uniref:dnaJ homolog subfamily C member 10 n=1 Tax=Lucilia cuprina TaxID=7375 RepID=UPI001F06B6BE|nr:dnaJ homolog subfamily C member 10 [Lucilia cuprina]